MKRATRQRLLLLGAAALLLGLALWQFRHEASEDPGTLLAIDPGQVSRITLTLRGASPQHFEQRNGHWWRIDGTPVRAIDGRLADLASAATARVLSWRPASDFDLTRIGLAPPRAVLTLDGHELDFGETAVTGPVIYVRVGGRVGLVSERYLPRSPGLKTTELR